MDKIIDLSKYFGKSESKLQTLGDGDGIIGNMDKTISTAKAIELVSRDKRVERRDIVIETIPFNVGLSGFGKDPYPFTNWSLGQICSHLGVPAQYVKKCFEENEFDFASENLNHWLRKGNQDKEYFLRETDERIQGFLSSSYGVMDDTSVLDVLSNIIPQYGDFTVKNSLVTPGLMNIRLIDRHKLTIDGEDLSLGLNIKNSRVGQSSLEVRLMIFKWICSNGLIFGGGSGSLYSHIHKGMFESGFTSSLKDAMGYMPKVVEDVKRWVEASKSNKLDSFEIQRIIDKLKLEGYSSKAINAKVIELMPKYGENVWGLSQAITEVSQDYSLDIRERMECFAGSLLIAS